MKPTENQFRDWETLHSDAIEVTTVELRNMMADSLRLRDWLHFAIIMAALGWTIAISFMVWWFVLGESACR